MTSDVEISEVRRMRLINMTGKAGSIKKAEGRRLKDERMTLGGDTLSGVVLLYRGGEVEMSLHIAHTLGEKVRKNIVLGL